MALCPRSCSMVDRRYWAPLFIIIIIFQTVVIFLLNDYVSPFKNFIQNNIVRDSELVDVNAVWDSRPEVSALYHSQEFQAFFLKSIEKSIESESRRSYLSHEFNLTKLSASYHPEDCQCGLHFKVTPEQALAFPSPKQSTKKFLTIGVPTVQRSGNDSNYLTTTVKSLLNSMKPEQRNDVILVIMVADTDKAKREWVLKELQDNFLEEIKSGNIHVIKAPVEYYKNLKVTKLTHGQPQQHVEWRSKQNFDYAYQMKYSAPLSHYYMQLEDDVTPADDYISKVQDFIKKYEKDNWICLEFSFLGFIGKLYRTEHLERLAQVMLMFFQEHPGDYLYGFFDRLMFQLKRILRVPTLFQHRGNKSSLPGSTQPRLDLMFDMPVREFKGDNPKATIFTTLDPHINSSPEGPYKPEGFFWSKNDLKPNDNYIVVLDSPHPVERIVIITGLTDGSDKLSSGSVVVSSSWTKGPPARCENSTVVGTFANGRVDAKDVTERVKFDVKCIEIKVGRRPRKTWMFLREVDVFVSKIS